MTKETPYFMVYGRDMNGPIDATLREWKEERKGVKEYTHEVVDRLERARKRMKIEMKEQKRKMKERYDRGREESDYKVGDLVWVRNREMEIGQHHKLAKKWKGPYRITAVDEEKPEVIDIRSVWNRQDEKCVNIALVKRAFVRAGQQIPQDLKAPGEEEGMDKEEEKEKEKGGEEEEKEEERGRKRKRGRRAGKKGKGREEGDEEEQIKARNKEGRTKFMQAERSGDKKRKGWTREEEEKEYQIKGIVQEIELKGGGRQYRIQFEGFSKLSDARWYDEGVVREEWLDIKKEWKRKKKTYGIVTRELRAGKVKSIRKGK